MNEGLQQVEAFMPTLSEPGATPEQVLEKITE
jgi:hypothetical protein